MHADVLERCGMSFTEKASADSGSFINDGMRPEAPSKNLQWLTRSLATIYSKRGYYGDCRTQETIRIYSYA